MNGSIHPNETRKLLEAGYATAAASLHEWADEQEKELLAKLRDECRALGATDDEVFPPPPPPPAAEHDEDAELADAAGAPEVARAHAPSAAIAGAPSESSPGAPVPVGSKASEASMDTDELPVVPPKYEE